MRILLVKPNQVLKAARCLQRHILNLEPLGLEIVAGGIPAEDEVRILDLCQEPDPQAFEKTVIEFQPDLIGFTSYSTMLEEALRLAALARQLRPEARRVVGGIHATLRPQDFPAELFDMVVRSEGGTVIGRIVESVRAGRLPEPDASILLPAHSDFSQQVTASMPAHPPIEEMPAPRRDLVDRSRYFCIWSSPGERRPKTVIPRVASVRTSAGCPFHCSFCAIPTVMNRRYFQRSPEAVADELEALAEDYVYFTDDEMFIDAKRAVKIAECLQARGLRKHYTSWARSDTILEHPEVFRAWRAAGLDILYVGLESMEAERLQEYGKKTTAEDNRRAAAILREIGITLHAALIVHPDFSEAEFLSLKRTVKELAPAEYSFTVLSPSPGTAFWEEQRNRFICDPFRYYDCFHTLLPTRLPLRQFYRHFAHISSYGMRMNPLRLNRVLPPVGEFFRCITAGTRYVMALYTIYKDYPESLWPLSGRDLLEQARQKNSFPPSP